MRDRNRRGILGLLALVLAALTACTTVAPPTPPPTDPERWTERGPITLAAPAGSSGIWRDLVARWNQTHPRELVTLLDLPDDPVLQRQRVAERGEAGSGELSVVVHETIWTPEFAAKGWVTELGVQRFPTSSFVPDLLTSTSWAGTRYALPVLGDVGVLYYRADVLRAEGIEPPTTWAELNEACRLMVAARPQLSCYLGQLRGEELTASMAEAIWGAGGELVSGGAPTVDSTAAITGVERLAHGVSRGIVPAGAEQWSVTETRTAFQQGRVLFARDWYSAKGVLERGAVGEIGVMPVPGETGVGRGALGGLNAAISAKARNKGTAAEFLQYLSGGDAQEQLLLRASGAPVRAALYQDEALQRQVPELADLATWVANGGTRPLSDDYRSVTAAFQKAGEQVLSGSRFPAQALEELQGTLEPLLKE